MDIESLKKRLAEVDASLLQTKANFNALEGSRQELLYWIEKLASESKESEKVIVLEE